MKLKFLNYNLEQLLEEKLFISYIQKDEHKQEWEEFLSNHVEFKSKAFKAREIINLLQDSFEPMEEKSVQEIWNNINQFEEQNKIKTNRIKFRRMLSWAASVLLIVSAGTVGYLYFVDNDNGFKFYSSGNSGNVNSRIVLSTGEEITFNKDNSTIILYDKANQIAVNDSIIELPEEANLKKPEERMNVVEIPYGQKSELLLADGTKVWLNAGSRLAFPSKFIGKSREVFLEGEACFKVVENKNQPFIVKTDDLNIKVLGTHFNVSAYPNDETIETVLLEGKVEVARSLAFGLGKEEVELAPNQKASFQRELNELKVSEDKHVDYHIAWTYGWLKYEKESLSSVLKQVERYYNVKIELPVNYPGDDKISGKLDLKNSLEAVMVVLADASYFNYRINGNNIAIEKKLKKLQ